MSRFGIALLLHVLAMLAIGLGSSTTPRPTSQPSRQPSSRPTRQPTSHPTREPSTPTSQPSSFPTTQPSRLPSDAPASNPTGQPTSNPTISPFTTPSRAPSDRPSRQPSGQPSRLPSRHPTDCPTGQPSHEPSSKPSRVPSSQPSRKPSVVPSGHPSRQPYGKPSGQPSAQPNSLPSSLPSIHPTGQPSRVPSCQPSTIPTTPSSRPTNQPSRVPSAAPTNQPSISPSNCPTQQPTSQPSCPPTTQPSMHPSCQPSCQPSLHPSQPSCAPSSQPSVRPSSNPSEQPSNLPTASPSKQPSEQPTSEPSRLPSAQPSMQPTSQPTVCPSMQPSLQPSGVPSCQPTKHPSMQPTNQPSSEPSQQPVALPSSFPSAQPSVRPSLQPSNQPSIEPSSQPSFQPSNRPSAQPSVQPSAQPSLHPSVEPTIQPSAQPSAQPTSIPSIQPTSVPSTQPTVIPTGIPSTQPSCMPSRQPTIQPTDAPSIQPTAIPTAQPSDLPSNQPSCQPTSLPTTQPSMQPSIQPSSQPSLLPTSFPTVQPTVLPTSQPSNQPSMQPSAFPSGQPTSIPSSQPSALPSSQPSSQPSAKPSLQPSNQPTRDPSSQPSCQPSSQPTNPSSQPTANPSIQPTGIPSKQPTSIPTSFPSPVPPCPAGSYYNLTGHSISGTFPVTGYYTCIICPGGTFSSLPKSHTCDICPAGTFSAPNSTFCTACPQNSYSENNGTETCSTCPGLDVNGVVGSKSKSDCVNPAINFIFGSVGFLVSIVVIFVYLMVGRMHLIAFQRKFRLVRKNMMLYGALLTTQDMVTSSATILDAILFAEKAVNFFEKVKENIIHKVVKPFIVFPLLCFILIPIVIGAFTVQHLIRIVFTSMVLWRAYKNLLVHDFERYLEFFITEIDNFLHQQNWFRTIAYPLVWLVKKISNIHINLNAVKVTCTGAQSPLYLLADLIIVGIVVMIIESDVHILWTTMVQPAMQKIRSMVFNRHYFLNIRKYFLSTLAYLSVAVVISQIPDPSKLVQYCMGFVVIASFFSIGGLGDSWVPHSNNCDGAIKFSNGTKFPIDSILANLSAIFAVIVLPAIVYQLSEVLFAAPNKDNNEGYFSKVVNLINCRKRHSQNENNVIENDDEESKMSFEERLDAEDQNNDLKDKPDSDDDLSDRENNSKNEHEESEDDVDRESKNQNQSSPTNNDGTTEEDPNLWRFESADVDHVPTKTSKFVAWLRIFASFFALDWLILKVVYNIGLSVFRSQKSFLSDEFLIDTYEHHDKKLETKRKSVKLHVDAFKYDDDLIMYRQYAQLAKPPKLPWFDGLAFTENYENAKQLKREKKAWKKVNNELPSYTKMVSECRKEMLWLDKYLPWSYYYLCWIPPAQVVFSASARQSWFRVFKTYIGMALVSIGIWPQWLVEDFDIIRRFDKFTSLSNRIYSRIGSFVYLNRHEDIFTKIDNNKRLAFAQFIAAVTTCRIALIQIVPSFTAWALFGAAIASTPMLVFSPEMDKQLPRMFAFAPYARARRMILHDKGIIDEPVDNENENEIQPEAANSASKLDIDSRIHVWLLGTYIFITQSRAIQCIYHIYGNVVALSMIFFPQYLYALIPGLALIIIHLAVLNALYVVLLLKKLLFPRYRDHLVEEDDAAQLKDEEADEQEDITQQRGRRFSARGSRRIEGSRKMNRQTSEYEDVVQSIKSPGRGNRIPLQHQPSSDMFFRQSDIMLRQSDLREAEVNMKEDDPGDNTPQSITGSVWTKANLSPRSRVASVHHLFSSASASDFNPTSTAENTPAPPSPPIRINTPHLSINVNGTSSRSISTAIPSPIPVLPPDSTLPTTQTLRPGQRPAFKI